MRQFHAGRFALNLQLLAIRYGLRVLVLKAGIYPYILLSHLFLKDAPFLVSFQEKNPNTEFQATFFMQRMQCILELRDYWGCINWCPEMRKSSVLNQFSSCKKHGIIRGAAEYQVNVAMHQRTLPRALFRNKQLSNQNRFTWWNQ